ncbi:MAG: ADP-ribosylglycohydrolase [Clostridiales bacterium]|nr:ADP-ribosylglycohydrolase [Clostridiales bacterium]
MKGAIIGDIVGSQFEFRNIDSKDFELFTNSCDFTDDTVMTCAVAKAVMEPECSVSEILQEMGRRYPHAGYGSRFINWVFDDNPQPYNSCGNGSAMRISPVGFAADTEEEVRALSKKVTEVTHNHPEGLKGAECTAVCILAARQGRSMDEIKALAQSYYTLDKTCDEWRELQHGEHGREICQISVPQALECFFESTDFEDCIRNCVSIGGDTDTIAAIAGGIAEAYYGIPEHIWEKAQEYLDDCLLDIVNKFEGRYAK